MGRFGMEPIEKEWFNKIASVENRQIDGRPLYKYRLTGSEYQELRDILVARSSGPESLDDLLSEFGFRILFVFFATEWYKREYNGGPWCWDDIFSRFTTKTVRNVASRSEAVRGGLKSLKIDIPNDTEGKKYFGAIITNGGLPAKYIQNNRGPGGIVGLIKNSLKYAIKYIVSEEDLYDVVVEKSSIYTFPQSLQQESMYKLIRDVVKNIVRLKERYKLNSRTGVITKLDAMCPNWREDFPILLEDDAIKSLLDTLIQEASETKVAQKRPFVLRYLEGDLESLEFKATIVFPDQPLEKDYFDYYFGIKEELPRSFYLNLWDENQTKIAKAEADLFKSDEYNLTPYQNILCPYLSVVVEAYSPNNTIEGSKVRLAEEIDLEAPLVFVKDDKQKYIYRGSGNVSIAESICYIAVHDTVDISSSNMESVATFCVKGSVFVLYKCDASNINIGDYEILLNTTNKTRQYVLGGRLLGYKTKPCDVYLGIPNLYYIDEEQNYIKEQHVFYTRYGSEETIPLSDCIGKINICCKKDGKIACKLTAFIVPENTRIEFENLNVSGGRIQIKNIPNLKLSPHYSGDYSVKVSDSVLDVASLIPLPPAKIKLGIELINVGSCVELELPFPVKGCGFYDEEKNCINGDVISFNDIKGKRIQIFGVNDGCEVTLKAGNVSVEKHVGTIHGYAEIKLIDFDNDIRFLFGNSAEEVRINISCGLGQMSYLRVFKYDAALEYASDSPDPKIIIIPQTNSGHLHIGNSVIRAFNLQNLSQPPHKLSVLQGSFVDLSQLEDKSGVYLLCGESNAGISIKPVVWRHIGNSEISDFYKYIVWGATEDLTKFLLKHAGEDYSIGVWNDVQELAKLFAQEDISADAIVLWHAIVADPKLLSMFLLRIGLYVPAFASEIPLSESMSIADKIMRVHIANVDKFLRKVRDELLVHTALIPRKIWKESVKAYKSFFNECLDVFYKSYIECTYRSELHNYMHITHKEQFERFKQNLWLEQSALLVNLFKESSYGLVTLMWAPEDYPFIQGQSDIKYKIIQDNMKIWAMSQDAKYWNNILFNDRTKLLNSYMNETGGFNGISVPFAALVQKCAPQCIKECSCYDDFDSCKMYLFDFDRFAEPCSSIVHFPILCGLLTYCGADDGCLKDADLQQAVKNFINFHSEYFIEAYKITTIIMAKL